MVPGPRATPPRARDRSWAGAGDGDRLRGAAAGVAERGGGVGRQGAVPGGVVGGHGGPAGRVRGDPQLGDLFTIGERPLDGPAVDGGAAGGDGDGALETTRPRAGDGGAGGARPGR